MHRAINRRLVVPAVTLTIAAAGFQLTARAQNSDTLRIPEAFANESSDTFRLEETQDFTPGTVEMVTERYPDGKVRIERQVTLDAQGNYVNHGAWKMWAQDGTAIADGQYDMGLRVGSWTRWYGRKDTRILNAAPFNKFKPPFVSQVTFVDDEMDGQWLIVDADEKQVMQVTLTGGKRNGPVIIWLPTGKIYQQANYTNGVPVGEVLEVNTKGELAVIATYQDGRKVITKTSHHNKARNIKKSEETFLAATSVEQTPDDFWNLTLAEYNSEGQDLRHGISKSWFESGKPRHEGVYNMDKKHGMFTYWHANGQMAATGEYKDDKPIGAWVWWHENGVKSAFGEYRDGFLYGQWRWWAQDGQLAKQKTYDGTEKITSEKLEKEVEVGTKPADSPTRTVR
jgi:antitoxin component YwqK of YwqJK toxin-antitoxin module